MVHLMIAIVVGLNVIAVLGLVGVDLGRIVQCWSVLMCNSVCIRSERMAKVGHCNLGSWAGVAALWCGFVIVVVRDYERREMSGRNQASASGSIRAAPILCHVEN